MLAPVLAKYYKRRSPSMHRTELGVDRHEQWIIRRLTPDYPETPDYPAAGAGLSDELLRARVDLDPISWEGPRQGEEIVGLL